MKAFIACMSIATFFALTAVTEAACFDNDNKVLARTLVESNSISVYVRENIDELTQKALARCQDRTKRKMTAAALKRALPQSPALDEIFNVALLNNQNAWQLLLAFPAVLSEREQEETEVAAGTSGMESGGNITLFDLEQPEQRCIRPEHMLAADALLKIPVVRTSFEKAARKHVKGTFDGQHVCAVLKNNISEDQYDSQVRDRPDLRVILHYARRHHFDFIPVLTAVLQRASDRATRVAHK